PHPRSLPPALPLSQTIPPMRPTRKLDYRRHGPFKITKVVSPHAYKLDLPLTLKIHHVQNVSLLDPASKDPFPGQLIPPPPPIEVDGEEEYYVDEILDSKLSRGRPKYLVRWIGWPQAEWQPAALYNKTKAVDDFHAKYPGKPGPLPDDDAPYPSLEFLPQERTTVTAQPPAPPPHC